MKGKLMLYIDQWGNKFWAHSLKELRAQVSGAVSKMYVDKIDSDEVFHVGYVIGKHWLNAYEPYRGNICA